MELALTLVLSAGFGFLLLIVMIAILDRMDKKRDQRKDLEDEVRNSHRDIIQFLKITGWYEKYKSSPTIGRSDDRVLKLFRDDLRLLDLDTHNREQDQKIERARKRLKVSNESR